jgi:hypothetical protein
MSNGWQLELSTWGDGTVRLAFWDSLHGHDEVFRLNEDGTADRSTGFIDEDSDEESWMRVDLSSSLRELLVFINGRHK